MKVYFLAFSSVSLTSVYIFMLELYCLDYCNSVVSFETGNCESFNSVFFQECFGYSGFLALWYFRKSLSISVKQPTEILRGIEVSLQIIFGSIIILTILNLAILELRMSFHSFRSPSISFSNVCSFQIIRLHLLKIYS